MTGSARLGAVMATAVGAPRPWQTGFQDPASPVMERLVSLHDTLLWITGAILLLVIGLLVFVMVRFRAGTHPEPATTAHNRPLEILWTVMPVLILVAVAVPSFRLLYYMDKAEAPELTVKVTGHEWYWEYQYPDQGGRDVNSVLVAAEDLKPGQLRLLEVDTPLMLPVDTTVRLVVTGGDVIHSWSVPAFGVKVDAIPGRLNETWVRVTREGTYYGQCSQLCGTGHDSMPIKVQVVPRDVFFASFK